MKLISILIIASVLVLAGTQDAEACKNAVRKQKLSTIMKAKSKLKAGNNQKAITYALRELKKKKANEAVARKIIAIAFVRHGKSLKKPTSLINWAQNNSEQWASTDIEYEQLLEKSGEILSNSQIKPIDRMYYAEYLLKVDPASLEGLTILQSLRENKVMPDHFGWFALARAEALAGNKAESLAATAAGKKKRKASTRKKRRNVRRRKSRQLQAFH